MPTTEKTKQMHCVHLQDWIQDVFTEKLFLAAFLANVGFTKVAVASNLSDKPLLSI